MPEARVRVGAVTTWTWTPDAPASAVIALRVADDPGVVVGDESLVVEGARVEEGPPGPHGRRPVRLHAERELVAVRYAAGVVLHDGTERECPRDDRPLPAAHDLAFDLQPWTLPSRYCPSDALGPTAEAELGDLPRTRALIPAVADWVRERIDYVPGASDALTTADQTLLARAGVCRDMAHLAISLLRALDVPARMVAAYAPLLEPPDFHALLEAHDGERWRLVDVTGLAPVATVVRIATGRDAADVAWAAANGPLTLVDVAVTAAMEG